MSYWVDWAATTAGIRPDNKARATLQRIVVRSGGDRYGSNTFNVLLKKGKAPPSPQKTEITACVFSEIKDFCYIPKIFSAIA